MIETLPVHPYTGLRALAVLASGRIVWPVVGASDEQDEDDDLDTNEDVDQDVDEQDEDGDTGEGQDEELGPKGRKALDAEKARRKRESARRRDAEARAKKAESDLAAFRNGGTGVDAAVREAEEVATARANTRIIRTEIKAAATGKLADPKDALRFLDLAKFEVDEDGELDEEQIAEAIDDLLERKPYLAKEPAQGGKRFQGTADGGTRKGGNRPRQLTRADLKKMTPKQINTAREKGQLNDLLGVER